MKKKLLAGILLLSAFSTYAEGLDSNNKAPITSQDCATAFSYSSADESCTLRSATVLAQDYCGINAMCAPGGSALETNPTSISVPYGSVSQLKNYNGNLSL
ncbi:hypothetical protein [Enterobacter asburiae]|uniref:hypothetical protein n=1 Tax=Enterobacter asburiae TaxID=61645 RepID=UPI00192B22EE|nr:hypothetical protein [Enterobacter asburiae]MBL5841378.1 hypothetical protein [Enterobacter asburiae]MBL5941726.1 hypothetical protein [Enterobacter asburiae]MBL5963526.1 hypothetical protein [Enterobacter asburiae]MBL5972175.1 hypothetical protein [Enterobacter asburiae]